MIQGNYILTREREDIDWTARSEGGILSPVLYRVTGDKDRDTLFMAEVVEVGPGLPLVTLDEHYELGHVLRLRPEAFVVAPGDMLMMSLYNVSYRIHRGGKPHFVVQNRYVAGKLSREATGEYAAVPLQQYVLLKAAPERAQQIMNGPLIWTSDGDSDKADDVGHGQGIMASYGEVVAIGPGRWDEYRFVRYEGQVGDLVLFDRSHSTLDINIQGRKYTLVDARQIVDVAASAAA
jgi:co-chaperonin GroES (HSP10)